MAAVSKADHAAGGATLLLLTCLTGIVVGFFPLFGFSGILAMAVLSLAFISQGAALVLLLIAMLLSPEIPLGGNPNGLEQNRPVTVRLDDFLLMTVCAGWLCRIALERKTKFEIPSPIATPMAAYVGVCIISTVMGAAAGRLNLVKGTLFVLKYIEYFIIFFVALKPLSNPEKAQRYLGVFIAVAVIVCIVGLSQIPGGHRISTPFEGDAEPNTLGAYVLLAGCAMAGLWFEGAKTWSRLAPPVLLIFAVTILFTLSRSSWLGVITATFTFIALSRRRLAIIAALLIAVAASPLIVPQSVKDRLSNTVNEKSSIKQVAVGNVKLDGSTSLRLQSWALVIKKSVDHLLIGHGVTGFGFVDAQYFKFLADTGIIGLFSFMWLLAALIRQGMLNLNNASNAVSRGISMGFIAGTVGLCTHAIGSNTFILVRVMEPFCFLAAFVVAAAPAMEAAAKVSCSTDAP